MEEAETLTVSEVNGAIKEVLENKFNKRVRVIGEVSNLKVPRHMYFSLKDEESIISVVIWSSYLLNCPEIENGQKITVSGYLSCYTKTGSFQINGRTIELLGTGELQKQYSKMKEEYEKKGYFDPAIKKPLPLKIRKVGVLTSLDGAALQDFLYVVKKNKFLGKLYLKNCVVQGKECPKSVATCLKQLDTMGLDLVVITRGGGSLEDLFGFSHPLVIEAIYQTQTPVISAIGHEVDWMLSDLVADIRAPTPSIAAEILCSNQTRNFDLVLNNQLRKDIYIKISRRLAQMSQVISQIERTVVSPKEIITKYQNRVNHILNKTTLQIKRKLDDDYNTCQMLTKRIRLAHPQQILEKGYCLLTDESGNFINSVEEFQLAQSFGQKLKIQLKNGYLIVDTKYVIDEST